MLAGGRRGGPEEEEEELRLVSVQGERYFFNSRQEIECLGGRDGGRWESGEDRK